MINYNSQNYLIDITEVATPSGSCNAVSIVETDVSVEFERPLDMPPSPVRSAPSQDVFNIPIPTKKKKKEEEVKEEEPKFQAFAGSGKRLDGKGIKLGSTPPLSSSPPIMQQKPTTQQAPSSSSSTSGTSTSNNNAGGMVFGSAKKPTTTGSGSGSAPTAKPKEEPKKDDPKFKAFSGTGRSLK